jgi:putative transposase
MNRTVPGEGWLADRTAAAAFVCGLAEAARARAIEVHAYCILPRHYHVLARGERSALLAVLDGLEAASGLSSDARARVLPVTLGRHLMSVSRYIHLNPVDAGLAWVPEQWTYSSFSAYLGGRHGSRFVQTRAILGQFGTIGARHRHRAYVYAGLDPATRDRDGRPHWALFPEGSLLADLAWRIEPVLAASPSPLRLRRPECAKEGLAALAHRVAETFRVPEESLRSVRGGGASAAVARGALVYAARSQGNLRLSDVAAFMGYAAPAGAAAAAERFHRALAADAKLASCLRAIVTGPSPTASAVPRAIRPAPQASPSLPSDS